MAAVFLNFGYTCVGSSGLGSNRCRGARPVPGDRGDGRGAPSVHWRVQLGRLPQSSRERPRPAACHGRGMPARPQSIRVSSRQEPARPLVRRWRDGLRGFHVQLVRLSRSSRQRQPGTATAGTGGRRLCGGHGMLACLLACLLARLLACLIDRSFACLLDC